MTENKDAYIHIRITAQTKAAYEAAAKAAGMKYSEWIRYQLNKAAGL